MATRPIPVAGRIGSVNFYSASLYGATGRLGPPLPGNPLQLSAWSLTPDGKNWLLDDLNVSALAFPLIKAPSMNDFPALDPAGLWLEITGVTNVGTSMTACLTLHLPATNQDAIYGLYRSTNLCDRGGWLWMGRTKTNQTSLILTNLPLDNAFFRLGPPNAIRPGFTNNILPIDDDYISALADMGFPINFYGVIRTNLYVNQNGNVTFVHGSGNYNNHDYNLLQNAILDGEAYGPSGDIIAPFWADVDPRGLWIPVTYGTNTVDDHVAFGVDWVDVGYYDNGSYGTDKINSFQLVIINRPDRAMGDYDVEFNYAQIQWEAGYASWGDDGLGGYSARIGFASVASEPYHAFEMTGSGVNGYFLDANPANGIPNPTGLIYTNFNSTVPGRYVFQFHNGEPMALPPGATNLPTTLPSQASKSMLLVNPGNK